MNLSEDIGVAVAPRATYSRLVGQDSHASWLRALERPLLHALLVGTSVAIAATGAASVPLVVSTTLSWGWVVVVQLVIAVVMTWPARESTRRGSKRIELWFAAHVPWTIWLLLLGPAIRIFPTLPIEVILLTMIAPIGWTMVIAAAFGREVMRRSRTGAWLCAIAHQLALVVLVLAYVAWSAGGWFRLIE